MLAVHDFCQLISDTIWTHHGEQLLDHIDATEKEDQNDSPNVSLSDKTPSAAFNDDLPF